MLYRLDESIWLPVFRSGTFKGIVQFNIYNLYNIVLLDLIKYY